MAMGEATMTAVVMMMMMRMRMAVVMTRRRVGNPKASMSGRLGGLACVRARTNQVDGPGVRARTRRESDAAPTGVPSLTLR